MNSDENGVHAEYGVEARRGRRGVATQNGDARRRQHRTLRRFVTYRIYAQGEGAMGFDRQQPSPPKRRRLKNLHAACADGALR